jgi:hypothetical protein
MKFGAFSKSFKCSHISCKNWVVAANFQLVSKWLLSPPPTLINPIYNIHVKKYTIHPVVHHREHLSIYKIIMWCVGGGI